MPITQDRLIAVTKTALNLYNRLKDLNKHAAWCETNTDPEIDSLFSLVWAVRDAQPTIELMAPVMEENAHFKTHEKSNITKRNYQRRKLEYTHGIRRRFSEEELSIREEGRITRSLDPEVRAQMIKDQEERERQQVPSTRETSFHKDGRSMAEILADQAALNAKEEEDLAHLLPTK